MRAHSSKLVSFNSLASRILSFDLNFGKDCNDGDEDDMRAKQDSSARSHSL
jgi:hypothetical protein